MFPIEIPGSVVEARAYSTATYYQL